MQASIQQRHRTALLRRSAFAAARAMRAGSSQPFVAPEPRCLGELRLADLVQAGLISDAEFETERAALLARL